MACFNATGTAADDNDRLTIIVKHGNRTSRHFFSKKVGIPSKADDLVGEALLIFFISSSVAAWKANSSFPGLLVSTSESSYWSSPFSLL